MKPETKLVSLHRSGRHIEMIVMAPQASSLYGPTTLKQHGDSVLSGYTHLLLSSHDHSPKLSDFRRLFSWIQNRVNPPPDVPEILERLQLTDEFGRLSQEHPLETLQMFAALNESTLTAEMVFDFE